MTDFQHETIKPPYAEIGENLGYDRNALVGYKVEKQIKRILRSDIDRVSAHLLSNHKIPESVKFPIYEEPEAVAKRTLYNLPKPYEYFTSIELMQDKVTEISSKTCLKALKIFEKDGLEAMIDYILKVSPIVI